MGGAQSYISSETALTVLVVAGAIGVGYTKMGVPSESTSTTSGGPAVSVADGQGTLSSKKGKKKKNQAKGGAASPLGDSSETLSASKSQPQLPSPHPPRVVAFPEVIPGQFDAVPANAAGGESSEPPASTSKPKKGKKKGKSKSMAAESTTTPPPAVSSSVDKISETSSKSTSAKPSKRPAQPPQGQKQPLSASASSSSRLTRPLQQSTASIDTDGSWTRVVSHKRGRTAADADSSQLSAEADPTTSDAGITPSVTGSSSPVAQRRPSMSTTEEEGGSFLLNANATSSTRDSGENRRTLAEKLLPKPRKTGVDELRLFYSRI